MDASKDIFIEKTSKTPEVDFNFTSGELVLTGVSIPENAAKFYEPLIAWTAEYIKSPRHTTNFRLNLEYYNSASSLWLAKMVKLLGTIDQDGYILFIHVYFSSDDYDDMEMDEIKDFIGSLVENIGNTTISIGVKAHGTVDNGKVIKESTILFSFFPIRPIEVIKSHDGNQLFLLMIIMS